jgi:hypothetical protein
LHYILLAFRIRFLKLRSGLTTMGGNPILAKRPEFLQLFFWHQGQ